MKKILFRFGTLLVASMLMVLSCGKDDNGGGKKPDPTPDPKPDPVALPDGKEIYKPIWDWDADSEKYIDLTNMDWQDNSSRWSYHRMDYTDNLVIFWGKGFGDNLSNPPQLGGQSMKVDLDNLKKKLEEFYSYYKDELKFVKEGSKSEKYRMMVMIQYSLAGTAYGGTYDDFIGAFWAAPNRLQDKNLNAVAHELGHSFQLQLGVDEGVTNPWGGSGFFEMTSQWMLWHVNPHWIDDETYHWEAYRDATHKAFLSGENIYRSPYIIEYWGEKHGLPFIADIYRNAKGESDDPAMTYMRLCNMSQEEFNDEMFEANSWIINFDFPRVKDITRKWANSIPNFKANMSNEDDGWYRVKKDHCPESYGFNAIQLAVPDAGASVTVDFCGLTEGDYEFVSTANAGWRYGFVAVTSDGETLHGEMCADSEGSCAFTTPEDKKLSHLWLLVMGAPQKHIKDSEGQWPYKIKIEGSEIL